MGAFGSGRDSSMATISQGEMFASVSGSNIFVKGFEGRARESWPRLEIASQIRREAPDRLPSRGARGKGDVHSEYKTLESLSEGKRLNGEVTIITDRYPCRSCRNAAAEAMRRAKDRTPPLVIHFKHVRPR
jgi:hypothetical protein